MKKFLVACSLLALALFAPRPAAAINCPVVHVFATGETLIATNLNSNPTQWANCFQNLDYRNVGALGFQASQITPLTLAQATFGGLLGYEFNPTAATQVALTISGASAQAADIFDVALTHGGTKVFFIANDGTTRFPQLTASAPVCIGASNQLTSACSAINFTMLNIGLGFFVGPPAIANVYPYQQVPGYVGGTITKIRAACSSADNGATVFAVTDNGSNITGSPYTMSAAATTTITLGAPFSLTTGHVLHMAVTTAGTANACGFTAEGQQVVQ